MATPEQEAFIEEMKKAKPRDVWKELWEARQLIKELREARPRQVLFPFSMPDPEAYNGPEGDYTPIQNERGGTPLLEYLRTEDGMIHIRSYTGPAFEERHDGDNC